MYYTDLKLAKVPSVSNRLTCVTSPTIGNRVLWVGCWYYMQRHIAACCTALQGMLALQKKYLILTNSFRLGNRIAYLIIPLLEYVTQDQCAVM